MKGDIRGSMALLKNSGAIDPADLTTKLIWKSKSICDYKVR